MTESERNQDSRNYDQRPRGRRSGHRRDKAGPQGEGRPRNQSGSAPGGNKAAHSKPQQGYRGGYDPRYAQPPRAMDDAQSKSILNVTNLTTIAVLIGLILFVVKIASVFGIFLFSFLIAFLLFPLVEWMNNRKVPRVLAIVLVYIVLGVVILGIAALVIPAIIAQADAFLAQIPQFIEGWNQNMAPRIEDLVAYLNTQGITFEDIQAYMQEEIVPNLQAWGARLGQALFAGVQGAIGGIVFMVTVPIIVFYLLLDARKIRESLIKFAPKQAASEIQNLLNRLARMLNHYIRGQLKLSFIMFAITTIALSIFGVKNALLLGLLAGITEVIPIIGPIIALIPALLVSFFTQSDFGILAYVDAGWLRALIVVGFYIGLQYVEGNFMVPRIMGKDLNLHPLTVMFSLLAGGYLAGLFGMILALPIAACLKVIFETYYPSFIQRVEYLISRKPRSQETGE